MDWAADLLWGWWNGATAWVVLILHAFGWKLECPIYNFARQGQWYAFGFLLGVGFLLGALGRQSKVERRRQ